MIFSRISPLLLLMGLCCLPFTALEANETGSVKRAGKKMSYVRVQGSHFINEQGDTLLFKGLSISDPDKIEKDGHWNRAHFEAIKSWGANLVRIPIHPRAYRERGKKEYLQLLDDAVKWCRDLEMYVIIDWHSIGNLREERFQDKMYETTMAETLDFWQTIAKRYKGNPTVAFFELYNEPTVYHGQLGSCTWEEWKSIVETMVDVVNRYNKKAIPLVAGFDWAYDLRDIDLMPIDRKGIAYVTHPYPGKCEPPREGHWETHFGFLADRYPIIATELGYYFEGEHHLIEDGTYRDAIVRFMKKKGISWCAWVFDPNWHPQMIENYQYEPTHQGSFFRDLMQGKYSFE